MNRPLTRTPDRHGSGREAGRRPCGSFSARDCRFKARGGWRRGLWNQRWNQAGGSQGKSPCASTDYCRVRSLPPQPDRPLPLKLLTKPAWLGRCCTALRHIAAAQVSLDHAFPHLSPRSGLLLAASDPTRACQLPGPPACFHEPANDEPDYGASAGQPTQPRSGRCRDACRWRRP